MIRTALIAAALLAFAAPVSAAPIAEGGVTLEELVDWFQRKGLEAEVRKDDAGVSFIAGGDGDAHWDIWLNDCDAARVRCSSIELVATFETRKTFGSSDFSTWNRTKRFARAYQTSDGAPGLAYDILVSPGGTWEAFEDHIGVWRKIFDEYWVFVSE